MSLGDFSSLSLCENEQYLFFNIFVFLISWITFNTLLTKFKSPQVILSEAQISILQPINDSLNTIEYSLGQHQNAVENCASPEPEEENEECILQSDELGSVHSLYPSCVEKSNDTSMDSARNDTPQSIPLADLDGELKLSSLSIASAKSWQSIKSYSSSIKVRMR